MQRDKPKAKVVKPAKVDYSSVASQLMKDYDYQGEGSLDKQGMIDLLTDAFKLTNRRLRVNKDDFETLFKLMDKDGDGRVTQKDLEAVVGKLMVKKEKEDQEREILIKQREEDRANMKSPLRRKAEVSPEKAKKGAKSKAPMRQPDSLTEVRDSSAKQKKNKTKEKESAKSVKKVKEAKEEKSTKKKSKK